MAAASAGVDTLSSPSPGSDQNPNENPDEIRESDVGRARPSPLQMSGVQNSTGPVTPTGMPRTPRLSRQEKERKIGHRRVDDEGQITYKKIQSTQLMCSIQLGISHSVGGLASKPERDLLMQDFAVIESTDFPGDGSSNTPAHRFAEYRFKTYAPVAFRYFRDLFGIQPDDFLLSMCNDPLRELTNPGASGSIFYLTLDDEFIIKTVQHKEGEFLQKLLPGYYMNLNQNPRTLLPKFFGLYCYQCGGKNIRLCIMNNLLPSSVKIHQKYDLKGSTYKRKANKYERNKPSPTYKDLDFMEHHPEGILMEGETYSALIKTIQRDCRVLESFKIMDYSLLVGIHNLDQAGRERQESHKRDQSFSRSSGTSDTADVAGPSHGLTRTKSMNRQKLVAHSTAMEAIQAEVEPIDEDEDVPPGGIPARNAKGERLLLFLGIIDILQSYRLRKKLEHTWKAMLHDGDTVSVHRPGFYAQRFQDFMAKHVFKKIPSLDLPEIKGQHRRFRTLVSSYIALKHSPSRKKNSLRHRPSNSAAPEQRIEDLTTKQMPASDRTDIPLSSTPPPSFEEAIRDSSSIMKQRSNTDPVPPTALNFAKSKVGLLQDLSQSDKLDAISISHIQLKTETTLSTHSIVSDSSATSGISSSIRTVTWTPPHSIEGSTPTHTEGTPSFTESSSSGDLGCPTTPVRGNFKDSSGTRLENAVPYQETEI